MKEVIMPSDALAELGITMEFKFVPNSFAIAAGWALGTEGINWEVTIKRGSKGFRSTYSAGIGYLPNGIGNMKRTVDVDDAIKNLIEVGQACPPGQSNSFARVRVKPPKPEDVMACIVLDAEVLDYATYDDYADAIGVNSDSRQGERVYKICMEQTLRLRALVGQDGLDLLIRAFEDY